MAKVYIVGTDPEDTPGGGYNHVYESAKDALKVAKRRANIDGATEGENVKSYKDENSRTYRTSRGSVTVQAKDVKPKGTFAFR